MTQNKYFISTDIEGISGVATRAFTTSKGKCYEIGKKYMTSDVNAVVSGILRADSNADITVKDAHGSSTNLDLFSLHPAAKLVQGWGNEMNMLFPLLPETKGVFLVGYHAGGHNDSAVIAHTFTRVIHHVKVNGALINEAGLAGIFAGHYNIPIAFIGGDDFAVKETKELIPDIVGVAVKKSYARDCALSLPISESAKLLEEGAHNATKTLLAGQNKPLKFKQPLKTEICLYNIGAKKSIFKHLRELLSFDKRFEFDSGNYTMKFTAESQKNILEIFGLLAVILGGIAWLEGE